MPTMFFHFFFFLITSFTTCFTHPISAVQNDCIESQKQSLLNLKESLIFDSSSSSKLITWNSSINCCSWRGVTCSSNGRIIGLDLSNESIRCSIDDSNSLFQLEHLQSLNLSQNSFNASSIPAAIGKLADLRYLDLSSTFFSGQIPIEVAGLTRLVTLDLSDQIYSSFEVENPNLSTLFQNLTELTELYFDISLNLSAYGSHWCEAISSSLPNLKALGMYGCGLRGPICESLANLQSLSMIMLGGNSFNASVPKAFANLSKLTYLNLQDSNLLGVFPKEIFQIPSLQTIDISGNADLHGSFPEFPNNSSLRSLTVDKTSFSGELPNSIGNLKMLSILDLSLCYFSGSLPTSIGNLTLLTDLRLFGNSFKSLVSLINWENLGNLSNLDLSNNQLYGTIPSSMLSLSKLYDLTLSNNLFSGQVPKVSNTSSYILRSLNLIHNSFEGEIPYWIFSLISMTDLGLAYNSFETLEAPRRNSTSVLSSLYLDSNKIKSIPSSFSFVQLNFVSLAFNNLTTFPDFLRNQSELTTLDLSNNQIRGEIPNWTWQLMTLDYYGVLINLSSNAFETFEYPPSNTTYVVTSLDFHSNKLQGEIPLFLSGDYLDYSENSFNSTIPSDIGNFISATFYLSFSSNNLHGTIPSSICNASSLVLDLSNNSLSGDIPRCLVQEFNPRSRSVLDLSRNKLTGTIPDEFEEGCELQTLDFSRNQLQGKFPKSLVHCSLLKVLNLGNNYITDSFPCGLMNTYTLHILVLQSNKFYGGIECPNTNDTWSALQVIDLARNNFSGDIPGRILLKWNTMMSSTDDSPSTLGYANEQEGPTDPEVFYLDAITAIIKGLEFTLVKIPNIFTLVDFSSNKFNGSIPEEIGDFTSLYVLNLSNNAFTGRIPSSFGQMQQIESLDLSNNQLSGVIPQQMAKLSFLAVLDLSNNELVGRIPTGTQFSTFPKTSFEGNKGLWGPPLTTDALLPPTTSNGSSIPLDSGDGIDWDLISAEIGFTCGFGLAVGSLLFCKRWRKWYYKAMRSVLFKIFPQLAQRYGIHRRHVYIRRTH